MAKERLEEIKNAPPVESLSQNSSSKNLYDAYAKQATSMTEGKWVKGTTDKEVVTQMMQDGRTPQRIQDALRHSPGLDNVSGPEKTVKAREVMQETVKENIKEKIQDKSIGAKIRSYIGFEGIER